MKSYKKLVKKIVISLAGCSIILCTLMGIECNLPKQETIELETVSDEVSTESKDSPFEVEAKAAILIDYHTGEVIFQQNPHEELPLASVTKVMTMLLVMESIDSGKISLEDEVTISERAASMGGSQMYMEVGETHTVEELLKGVAMASANDACVALSEYVAGSEEIFVERMNEKARELNMLDSNFVNTNGLPVANHYSSAYDISIMSRELYKYEKVREWFTTWQDTITVGLPGKEKEFGLTNTNKLIKQYQGCDGIKTGFTVDAGYCLSASAMRENTRFIAVVLGCETSEIRNTEVSKLFDYGFANYETYVVAEKGEILSNISVEKGTPQSVDVITEESISLLIEKGTSGSITTQIEIDEKVKLPIAAGDELGKLVIYQGEEKIKECSLVAKDEVQKSSFWELISRTVKKGRLLWRKNI